MKNQRNGTPSADWQGNHTTIDRRSERLQQPGTYRPPKYPKVILHTAPHTFCFSAERAVTQIRSASPAAILFCRKLNPGAPAGCREAVGMAYKPLARLPSEVVFTCLNKNVLLLGKGTEFTAGHRQGAVQHTPSARALTFCSGTVACSAGHPLLLVTPVPLPARWVKTSLLPVRMCIARMFLPDAPGRLFVLLSQKVLANIRTALGE